MIRVEIKPELLSWARERAGFDTGALAHRFPKLAAWEQGTARPTLKQVMISFSSSRLSRNPIALSRTTVDTLREPKRSGWRLLLQPSF